MKAEDPIVLERVMSCPAVRAKSERVRATLEGRLIERVEFVNESRAVGIRLHLDNEKQVVVSMAELSLIMLLRDPDVARQEQDLYYRKHAYRPIGRRRRKGKRKEEANG